MPPTARSLQWCRDNGWEAGVVERYNSFTKQRHDLWGCVDLIVVEPGAGIIGVQACAGSSHAARMAKAREKMAGHPWMQFARVEVWSWSKRGGKGKRKTWQLRKERVDG